MRYNGKKSTWRKITEGACGLAAMLFGGCGYFSAGTGFVTYDNEDVFAGEGSAFYEVRGGIRTPSKLELGLRLSYDKKETDTMQAENLRVSGEAAYPIFSYGLGELRLLTGFGTNRSNVQAGSFDGIADTPFVSVGASGTFKLGGKKGEIEAGIEKEIFDTDVDPKESTKGFLRWTSRF